MLKGSEEIEFESKEYCSVYLAGATEIVASTLGDTEGLRPFYVGLSSSWRDAISSSLNRYSPTFRQGLWFRFWLASRHEARLFQVEIARMLAPKVRHLSGNALGLAPCVDMDELQLSIMTLAEGLDIVALDDEELRKRLQRAANKSG